MNPPPSKEIIRLLMASNLELVSHGRYVVHLSFENGNSLSFAGPFRFAERRNLANAPICNFPVMESKLVRILGCHIAEIECDTDGTLELWFSSGDVLIVYANDPAYEAYTLKIEGKEYIV